MSIVICPKCGFRQQDEGLECRRCGIIFARLHPATFRQQAPQKEPWEIAERPAVGLLRRSYHIFRWVSLAGLILVIVLILRASPPPRVISTPNAAQHAADKVREFQSSVGQGRGKTLDMDESELNEWIGANLALKRPNSPAPARRIAVGDSVISLPNNGMTRQADENPAIAEVRSSVREVKIALREDSLRVYAAFEMHGMDLSLELEGRLLVQDGYLRLEPTSGKLGSLPLPAGTLQKTANILFDSPQNKEKFHLPPDVRDMRIERGHFIVSSH